eukprot:CAMPEP_0197665036 /NCGR_PEP_ID=MMETSP1338-20131121/58994_1 /TAXON_ID=43686 ORGANISM="Pelagodinium beii, Strain RCC1491" /NCGR_SAMPLE_ID=MMETSP1338 /ASSEMBLY_ACC=CAM_ASM_000754 /LENGTH=442 /DNA_ID=CAMNT_0043243787 /DNA_START=176 /DNA_END=1504 /DNA_ORIENTATION=-
MAILKELAATAEEGQYIGIDEGNYDNRTVLHTMAASGDLNIVQFLVDNLSADINAEDRFGGTPLDDALRMNKKDVAKFLTSKGASVGKCFFVADDSGALCDAASRGDKKILRMLHKRGVNVDNGDYDKRTAMHLAAAEGQLEALKCLAENCKADVNVKDRWSGSPLDDALRTGNDQVFEYLKAKGAVSGKISTVKAEDATALCDCGFSGNTDHIKEMIEHGLDINLADYDDRTALHLAASEGLMLAVQILIKDLGADPNVSDRYGGTPLDDAIRAGHTRVAEFLQAHGGLQGKTAHFADPEFFLLEAGATGDLEMLRRLHQSKVDMSSGNEDGRTALHMAAANGHVSIAQELIKNMGVNVNIQDRFEGTPLDDAVENAHQEVIKYLISQGGQQLRKVVKEANIDSEFSTASTTYEVFARKEDFHEINTSEEYLKCEQGCELM